MSSWAMLLLGTLLATDAAGQISHQTVHNYNLEIAKGVLMSVTSGEKSSGTLDLSNLCIRRLDTNCFKEAKGLKKLTLRFNGEEDVYFQGSLPPLVFRFLPDLEELALLDSDLHDLRYVLWGLPKLRVLDLRGSTVNLQKGSLFGLSNRTNITTGDKRGVEVEPMHFLKPYPYMSLCMLNGIVQTLELLKNPIDLTVDCNLRFMPLRYEMAPLDSMGIKGFAKGWYRIDGVPVRVLSLMRNDIEHLEGDLLNDLPKDLCDVYLSWNNIKRVKSGKISNMNLRVLDLRGNPIITVDPHALTDTNLTKLTLSFEFMKSLPRSLKNLDFSDPHGDLAINSK